MELLYPQSKSSIRGSQRVNWFAVDLWREKCALNHGIFEKNIPWPSLYPWFTPQGWVQRALPCWGSMSSKKKKKFCEKISPLFKYNSNLYKKSAVITRLLPIPQLPHHQIWILEHLLNCAALLWVGMCYMLANITKLIKL